mmetsp:Transcript_25560/g.64845  ORF Transcript_25560/g.64845 Transcript_25560/m.64845 type:complete len:296 (-) Transcript_25560:370-1257(-)
MPPPTLPKIGAGHGIGRSRSATDRDESGESIYATPAAYGGMMPPAAPKIRTYNVVPTSPTGAAGQGKPRMHADSSQISNVLNPVHGVRDAQKRQGVKPFDYAKSNALAIKEASHLNALRKASVKDQTELTGGQPSYMRSNSAPSRRGPPAAPVTSNDGRNFLQENKLGAGMPMRPPKPTKEDDSSKYLKKKDYGRVPEYLVERKMELAEHADAVARAKEAALIPPGMRLLPEEERLETLAILERNKRDVEKALQSMPIIIETPSQIRRKDELEKRLKEIDDAFKVFSRAKVLVHI